MSSEPEPWGCRSIVLSNLPVKVVRFAEEALVIGMEEVVTPLWTPITPTTSP